MVYRTIIEKEKWKEFAEELYKRATIKFSEGDFITEYNPFNYYIHVCILEYDDLREEIVCCKNVDNPGKFVSHEEFISICEKDKPKKKESVKQEEIGCFVERNQWSVFVNMLQEFTSVRWIDGQKPKEFEPCLDVGYVFIGLGEVDGNIGIYTQDPEFVYGVVTKTEFIFQCCKRFPKK
jgi:hypothetical protein